MTCQKQLHEAGLPYPRTCADCGLGPCHQDMTKSIRYCVDCKHCHTVRGEYPIMPTYYCIHPDIVTPAKANLVTKVVSYLSKNKKLCSKERKSQKGLCGVQGLLWERAPRPLPPPGAKRSVK